MAETQGSKFWRRFCSSDPSTAVPAIFSHRYISYLLPALFKVGAAKSCHGNKDRDVRKVVRFEVDMALVLSASGFAWSRALGQKLEQGMDVKKPRWMISTPQLVASNLSLITCKKKSGGVSMVEVFGKLWTAPLLISRPLAPAGMHGRAKTGRAGCTSNPKRRMSRAGEELRCCIGAVRKVLPGGDEMGVRELLCEVESYVVCLQMQVSALRSLLDAPL